MFARLLPLAVVLLVGCGARTGTGVAATESRPLGGCRGVRAYGSVVVTVSRGDAPSLSVTWDDNLLPLVRTEVREGLLEVSVRGVRHSAGGPPTVTVVLPVVRSVTASGQAAVVADVGEVEQFTGIAGGRSRVTLRGRAGSLDLDAADEARLDAHELAGGQAWATAGGVAWVSVGAVEKLSVIASDHGAVDHDTADAQVGTNGRGTVRRR